MNKHTLLFFLYISMLKSDGILVVYFYNREKTRKEFIGKNVSGGRLNHVSHFPQKITCSGPLKVHIILRTLKTYIDIYTLYTLLQRNNCCRLACHYCILRKTLISVCTLGMRLLSFACPLMDLYSISFGKTVLGGEK